MRFKNWAIACVVGIITLVGITTAFAGDEKDVKIRKHANWGYNDPDWTADVPDGAALQSGDHPRLVFRKGPTCRVAARWCAMGGMAS